MRANIDARAQSNRASFYGKRLSKGSAKMPSIKVGAQPLVQQLHFGRAEGKAVPQAPAKIQQTQLGKAGGILVQGLATE